MMRRVAFLALALTLSAPVAAQTAPPAAAPAPVPPPGPHVGYIRIDGLTAAPPVGLASWHDKLAQVDNEFRPRMAELQQLAARAQSLDAEAAAKTSPEVGQVFRDEATQVRAELQRKGTDAQAQYVRRQQEVMGPLFGPFQTGLRGFATERGYTDIPVLIGPQAMQAKTAGYTDLTAAFITWYRTHGGA